MAKSENMSLLDSSLAGKKAQSQRAVVHGRLSGQMRQCHENVSWLVVSVQPLYTTTDRMSLTWEVFRNYHHDTTH